MKDPKDFLKSSKFIETPDKSRRNLFKLPDGFYELDYGGEDYTLAREQLIKLRDEVTSFLLNAYKEFFGKEYKEGDTIPEDKQEEWTEFIKNKVNAD